MVTLSESSNGPRHHHLLQVPTLDIPVYAGRPLAHNPQLGANTLHPHKLKSPHPPPPPHHLTCSTASPTLATSSGAMPPASPSDTRAA
jgi:hypothetical protein